MSVSRECNWIITLTSGFFQIKIENICLFRLIKKHGNVFKNWLCPNFLLPPKKCELPRIRGGCSPPRPPARTPMIIIVKSQSEWDVQSHNWHMKVLDFAPFCGSYVREFELSHDNPVNRIIKITHEHNLHMKMLVFGPFTICTLKKTQIVCYKIFPTILRNPLNYCFSGRALKIYDLLYSTLKQVKHNS